jgi:hypothetical protein
MELNEGNPMRIVMTAVLFILSASIAPAQTSAQPGTDSSQSTGRTVSPATKGQSKSGGAPAESPQGQTPPGMQAAPEGSSKTIVEPKR